MCEYPINLLQTLQEDCHICITYIVPCTMSNIEVFCRWNKCLTWMSKFHTHCSEAFDRAQYFFHFPSEEAEKNLCYWVTATYNFAPHQYWLVVLLLFKSLEFKWNSNFFAAATWNKINRNRTENGRKRMRKLISKVRFQFCIKLSTL